MSEQPKFDKRKSPDWNSNPRGLGGLAFRPHDRFAIGVPVTPMCGAKTKNGKDGKGSPCRCAPVTGGSGRCRFHGGLSTGRGKPVLWKTRQAHSKANALTRKSARAELERATLHPDTMRSSPPMRKKFIRLMPRC